MKIQVRALRMTPIHPQDHVLSPSIETIPVGDVVEVEDSPNIRRRIRAGDLERVTAKPTIETRPTVEFDPAKPVDESTTAASSVVGAVKDSKR